MRIKPEDLSRIADRVVSRLRHEKRFTAKVPDDQLKQRALAILTKNLEEEAAIEEEARRMLDQYEAQIRSGQLNEHKVFVMVKAKIAKERDFVL